VAGQVVSVMGSGFTSQTYLYVGQMYSAVCRLLNTSSALCSLPSAASTSAYQNAQVSASGLYSNVLYNAVQYIPSVSCTSVHTLCLGPLQASFRSNMSAF
jgi:hypothetical protein